MMAGDSFCDYRCEYVAADYRSLSRDRCGFLRVTCIMLLIRTNPRIQNKRAKQNNENLCFDTASFDPNAVTRADDCE
jgi:hypothetical protein